MNTNYDDKRVFQPRVFIEAARFSFIVIRSKTKPIIMSLPDNNIMIINLENAALN